jgi:hypothetical protein
LATSQRFPSEAIAEELKQQIENTEIDNETR